MKQIGIVNVAVALHLCMIHPQAPFDSNTVQYSANVKGKKGRKGDKGKQHFILFIIISESCQYSSVI